MERFCRNCFNYATCHVYINVDRVLRVEGSPWANFKPFSNLDEYNRLFSNIAKACTKYKGAAP